MVGHSVAPSNWPVESDWTDFLKEELESPQFQSLMEYVATARIDGTVFPPDQDVFNAFRSCPLNLLKVVILGQDPYHGEGQAHGLAFSVPGNQKLPPSLRNIFKELRDDLGIKNTNGDLTSWARQGILLLNTVLTVNQAAANSHRGQGWEEFTDAVIRKLGERQESLIFVLWGNPAIKKKILIGEHHTVLQSPHPSPLSSYRGFFGSRPFSMINKVLQNAGKTAVDWSL